MLQTLSKFALLVLVGSVLYLLFSGNLISSSPFVIASQLSALALSAWTRQNFQKNQFSIHAEPKDGPLLQTGPFKLIRHPMYASALLLVWSSVLGHGSFIAVILAFMVTGFIVIRIIIEDQFLGKRFPGYREYSLHTKRVIPFVL